MAKNNIQVGDVVWWHWPQRPELEAEWRKEHGQDPLLIVEMEHFDYGNEWHPKLIELNTGLPVRNGRAVNSQVFRKDEFLTAVYRASGNINPKTNQTKKERKPE